MTTRRNRLTTRLADNNRRKVADPYLMNQERTNPPVEKYMNGDPSSWAEDQMPAPSYPSKRTPLGLPDWLEDTWDHKNSDGWGEDDGVEYDNEYTKNTGDDQESRLSSRQRKAKQEREVQAAYRKARLASRIAKRLLASGTTRQLEAQALDLMHLPVSTLVATLRRMAEADEEVEAEDHVEEKKEASRRRRALRNRFAEEEDEEEAEEDEAEASDDEDEEEAEEEEDEKKEASRRHAARLRRIARNIERKLKASEDEEEAEEEEEDEETASDDEEEAEEKKEEEKKEEEKKEARRAAAREKARRLAKSKAAKKAEEEEEEDEDEEEEEDEESEEEKEARRLLAKLKAKRLAKSRKAKAASDDEDEDEEDAEEEDKEDKKDSKKSNKRKADMLDLDVELAGDDSFDDMDSEIEALLAQDDEGEADMSPMEEADASMYADLDEEISFDSHDVMGLDMEEDPVLARLERRASKGGSPKASQAPAKKGARKLGNGAKIASNSVSNNKLENLWPTSPDISKLF